MRLVKNHCPCCDERITYVKTHKKKVFPCPHCGKPLKMAEQSARIMNLGSIIILTHIAVQLLVGIFFRNSFKMLYNLLNSQVIFTLATILLLIGVCMPRFEAAEAEEEQPCEKDV